MWLRRVLLAVTGYALFALALGTSYAIAQHDGRNAAEDAPRALLSSATVAGEPARLDLTRAQGVFWARYGSDDRVVKGNGYLDGALADIPSGVLDAARAHGVDAVTWQPRPGLRFAIVAEPRAGGDVLVAGQSLTRTEARAADALVFVALALGGGLLIVAAALAVSALVR